MRYLLPDALADLARGKMLFVGGPRQCGKTTFARQLAGTFRAPVYLNWDHDGDRRTIQRRAWSEDADLLVFDELHKFGRWKNWVKGLYDVEGQRHRIVVTGSARLDVYRRGGDSLLGRYHYWRLHPFSLSERPKGIGAADALDRLLRCGGFPEPFLDGGDRFARRWRRDRFDRVLRDDVRDLEGVRDIRALELLVDLLRQRVGSPIVVSNLAEDLQVAPKTVAAWLEVLERMYLVFVVRPYTTRLARAIRKPPKVYFFDNADVDAGPDPGPRFENLVASHLLKALHHREDRDGHRLELRYLRDKEGREVDFVVVRDGKIEQLVEAKWSDAEVAPHLRYYAERLRPERARQIVGTLRRAAVRGGIRVEPVTEAFPPLA